MGSLLGLKQLRKQTPKAELKWRRAVCCAWPGWVTCSATLGRQACNAGSLSNGAGAAGPAPLFRDARAAVRPPAAHRSSPSCSGALPQRLPKPARAAASAWPRTQCIEAAQCGSLSADGVQRSERSDGTLPGRSRRSSSPPSTAAVVAAAHRRPPCPIRCRHHYLRSDTPLELFNTQPVHDAPPNATQVCTSHKPAAPTVVCSRLLHPACDCTVCTAFWAMIKPKIVAEAEFH